MELIRDKSECCGCTACEKACPTNAITMVEDNKGFLYPEIDFSTCIECGLCKKICTFSYANYDYKIDNTSNVYAVKNKDELIRRTSSSGGVFVAISDYILENNGVVYGAKFDEKLNVIHSRANTKDERDKFKGSKYVQSNLNDIFCKVKEDLKLGIKVLFTGTPCQIAGLKSYLGKNLNLDNLYLCDIVCHGVPGAKIFNEYKKFMSNIYKSDIESINFRSKTIPGEVQDIKIKFKNGKEFNDIAVNDVFYRLFLDDIILRPSCYNCRFASIDRESDITLADYWGIEKSIPTFEDKKGVSLVLVNSEKGKKIFSEISHRLIIKESCFEDCMQPCLKESCKKSNKVDLFWNDYDNKGFGHVAKKYGYYGFVGKIRRKIKKINRGVMRRIRILARE